MDPNSGIDVGLAHAARATIVDDSALTCQWNGCNSPHHPTAEALYDHVCETHIGRKSTNNLNLQCFWGACRTTTVKRDHITSHIRVHVPLKPHKCDVCQKSFKRPQDLKKHVKTHADESVLFNSPQPGMNSRGGVPNGYQAPHGKHDGSYPDAPGNQHLNYNYGMPQNPYANAGFAPVYGGYNGPQPAGFAGLGLTESRKRHHDALNDFFGQAKRRQLDPAQYQDLGAQFSHFLSMFAPLGPNPGAWQGGYNGYNGGFDGGGGGMAYQAQHAPPMSAYPPAFPEMRTKNDLMSIDQFLAQLQNTVYENADQTTAGYEPVTHSVPNGGFAFPRRASGSPTRYGNAQTAATPGSYSNNSFAHSSNMEETPALTPSSFQTSQSPQSTNRNLSPNSRPASTSLYPTLPSFNTLDTSSSGQFGAGPTSAPPSGLGPQYDDFDGRRRYSGGQLQRERQGDSNMEGVEHKEVSEAEREAEKEKTLGETIKQALAEPEQVHVKLPGVSEITRGDGETERKEVDDADSDPRKEAYMVNVKTIEALRTWISQRLQKGEYDADEEEGEGDRTPRANQDTDVEMSNGEAEHTSEGAVKEEQEQATTPKREGASLYPMLRPVEA